MITFEDKKNLSTKLKKLKQNVENCTNSFDIQSSPSRWLWREYMMFMNDILLCQKLETKQDKEDLCEIIDKLKLDSFNVSACNDFAVEKNKLINHIDDLLKDLM